MSSGKILLGVLAGVAAGAALWILFAPDKGVNTRKKIVQKGNDYVDSVKDKLDDLLDSISSRVDEVVDGVKEGVSDVAEKAKTKA